MKWFWPLLHMLRLSLNWHHVWSWLSLTHSQSMTRKAVCLAANSKGNARLNENYFLVGLSFTSRFPSQTTLDEICWMPFVVVTFSPPSPSVQVRIFYQLPKELKYHTIGYNFSLIKSRSAQAWGPTYIRLINKLPVVRKSRTRQILTCTNPSALFLVQKKWNFSVNK